MANNYLTLILITYMVFGHKSIKLCVNSEIHHIRHHNHHQNHNKPISLWTISEKNPNNKKHQNYTNSEVVYPKVIEDDDYLVPSSDKDTYSTAVGDGGGGSGQNTRDSSDSVKIKCPKCSGSTNVRVSEEDLIQLRIEFVKNQILQKLRLKERPQVSVSGLPKPIYEGATIHTDEKTMSKDLDDYYARTSQKFIILKEERRECERVSQSQSHNHNNPSICFTFKIDGDVESIDVNTAELWIHKRSSSRDHHKQTLVISELDQGLNEKYLPKAKPIAIQSAGVEEGWIKIDIAWLIRKWFDNHELSHIIQISCQFCEMDLHENFSSTEKDSRPFIVIDTFNRRKIRRQKRSVNCSAGVTECCREKLYISFAEIGWDDWILHPPGYDAYFCRGSCTSVASITMSNSHYSSILRKVLYKGRSSGGKPLELIPCCTAKQFSSLQLVYVDSNNTGTVKTLPNMVVESCGCM